MTASDNMTPRQFYHGTQVDLKPGDLIAAGYSSNYGARKEASLGLPDRHTRCGHLGCRVGHRRRTGKDLHRGADRSDRG